MLKTFKTAPHKGWKVISVASVLAAACSIPVYSTAIAAQDETARTATPYPHRDIRSVRPALAEEGIKRASQGRIVITIWGSTDRVRAELRQAADELFAEGVPISLYYAGAINDWKNTGYLTFHSNGEQLAHSLVYPNTSDIRQTMIEAGKRYAKRLTSGGKSLPQNESG